MWSQVCGTPGVPAQLQFVKTTRGAACGTIKWGWSNFTPQLLQGVPLGIAQPSEHTPARGLAPKPSPSWLRGATVSSFALLAQMSPVLVGKAALGLVRAVGFGGRECYQPGKPRAELLFAVSVLCT